MTKALIFGEYKIARFLPVLLARGYDDIVVYSAVEFDEVPGIEVRLLSLEWSADDVLRVLDDERPAVAIANPYAHGQEQLPIAYGEAAQRWGGRFVTHPAAFAGLACDKAVLHRTAVERGWPVPTGTVCDDPDAVRAAAAELGFPLVVKEAQAQAGDGRYVARSADHLEGILSAGLGMPSIVQQFERGEETGIELISGDDGALMRWPVVSMGPLDLGLDPSLRARVAPYQLPKRAAGELDELLADITSTFAPFGPWQLDIAVVRGGIKLLEINARLGGLTELDMVVTGTDPHRVFTAAALGDALPELNVQAVTIELPSTEIPGVEPPEHPEGAAVVAVTARTATNRCFINSDRMQLVTTVREIEAGKQWVKELDGLRLLRCSVESAHRQLDHGFDVFTQAGGS